MFWLSSYVNIEKVNHKCSDRNNSLIPLFALFVYLLILAVRALRKYIKSGPARKEAKTVRTTPGEKLRENRVRCKLSQEFVAEAVGVSRQAVSKWENGVSDPSTSNLIELAKL